MSSNIQPYVIMGEYLNPVARDRVDRDHYDLAHWSKWSLGAAIKTSLVSLFIALAMRQAVIWLPLASVVLLVLWLVLSSRLNSLRVDAASFGELVRVDESGLTLFGYFIPGHLITGIASVGTGAGDRAHLVVFLSEKVVGNDMMISQSVGSHQVIGTSLTRFIGPEATIVKNREILEAAGRYGVPTRVFATYQELDDSLRH